MAILWIPVTNTWKLSPSQIANIPLSLWLTVWCITCISSLSTSILPSIFIIQGSSFKTASCEICFLLCDMLLRELTSHPHMVIIIICNLIDFSLPTQHLLQKASWTCSGWQRHFRSWTGGSLGSMGYNTFLIQPYLALLLSVLGHMTTHKSIAWQIKCLTLSRFHCVHLLIVSSWDKTKSSLVWKFLTC